MHETNKKKVQLHYLSYIIPPKSLRILQHLVSAVQCTLNPQQFGVLERLAICSTSLPAVSSVHWSQGKLQPV